MRRVAGVAGVDRREPAAAFGVNIFPDSQVPPVPLVVHPKRRCDPSHREPFLNRVVCPV